MSGPVSADDVDTALEVARATEGGVLLEPGRRTTVGELPVRRVLPQRPRRTVGAWCFADHMGPVPVTRRRTGSTSGPTRTWACRPSPGCSGELLHRDSLGSEQVVRPGQLNLMTAGRGVAHAEENTGRFHRRAPGHPALGRPARGHPARPGRLRASRRAARRGARRLRGHRPRRRVRRRGVTGPARHRPHGCRPRPGPTGTVLPLRPECEHALIVLEGAVTVGDKRGRAGDPCLPG